MSKIYRCITTDGSVMASAIDSTDIVSKAEDIHSTSAVVTAALGRLLTAASLMGNMLKGEKHSLSIKINGGGPAGSLVVAADSTGNVRGYVQNSVVELPLNAKGKLDVGGAVGTDGTIHVIKDVGLKEPYNGAVPLVTGEIAEDITAYYAFSEQIPTVCALGVLVNPDLTVKAAGGYIIQLLPGADDKVIDAVEKSIAKVRPISTMISLGMTPEDCIKEALSGFEIETVYTEEVDYLCRCSRERTLDVISGISVTELEEMYNDGENVEISCHFCNKNYVFTPAEIGKIIKSKKS